MADAEIRRSEVQGLVGGPVGPVRRSDQREEAEAAEGDRRSSMGPASLEEAKARDAIVEASDQPAAGLGGAVGEVSIPEGDRNLGSRPIEGRKAFDEQEVE